MGKAIWYNVKCWDEGREDDMFITQNTILRSAAEEDFLRYFDDYKFTQLIKYRGDTIGDTNSSSVVVLELINHNYDI